MKLSEKHISLVITPEVKQITQPLAESGIDFFHHIRCFRENLSYIILTNNPGWHKHFTEMEMPGSFSLLDVQQGIYPWETVCVPKVCTEAHDYNMDNFIELIYPTSQYVDIFGFATVRDGRDMRTLYMNSFDSLVKFTKYFQEKSRDLFLKADKDRLQATLKMVMRTHNNSLFAQNLRSLFYKLDGFIQTQKVVHLTGQEWKCIKYESWGMSAKEIAKKMEISPKTVETHWRNVANKTGCITRLERIKLLQQYYKDKVPYLDRDK